MWLAYLWTRDLSFLLQKVWNSEKVAWPGCEVALFKGHAINCLKNLLKNLLGLRLHFCINRINALSSTLLISCALSPSVMSLWPHGLQPARLLCPWGLLRQEYWNGLPCPPPGDLSNPGIEPGSPALQAHSLPAVLPGMLSLFHNPAKLSLGQLLGLCLWILTIRDLQYNMKCPGNKCSLIFPKVPPKMW